MVSYMSTMMLVLQTCRKQELMRLWRLPSRFQRKTCEARQYVVELESLKLGVRVETAKRQEHGQLEIEI